MTPNSGDLYALAKRHANAWSAHDAEGVAELYEESALFISSLGEPMNGLISRSDGWYDAEDYERQCQEGYQGARSPRPL